MIQEFRYDLFNRVENDQEPLIVSVCGISIPKENGFLIVNGKLGTLGVCADGRLQFLPYPFDVKEKLTVKDEYTLIVNTGKVISISYWWKGGNLYSEKR